MMRTPIRLVPAAIAALLALAAPLTACAGEAAPAATPEAVQRALDRGSAAALRNLQNYRRTGTPGYPIVSVMALLNAGFPPDHPEIAATIKEIARASDSNLPPYEGTYHAGLTNMLLAMLKDPQYRRLAERMARALQNSQQADGGWGDYSRTQFALLGLQAAHSLGVAVPPEVFRRALKNVESGQLRDGSWGYTPTHPNGYGSMTAAGISSLYICYEQEARQSKVCGAAPNPERIQRGLKWLGDHFSVRQNPGHRGYHFYYLYALERIGVLTGQRFIGTHDWYREGVEYLLSTQSSEGTWTEDTLATEFALLFIGKGREPIVIQKLAFAGEWNTVPYDTRDLVERASRELRVPMATQIVGENSGASAFAEAPILYLQGHSRFAFSPETRAALKLFVENGGFIVGSACCASPEFARSFRNEMGQIFPDGSFEKLPPAHELYTVKHALTEPAIQMLEGLNNGCRTAVFFAPHPICCGWGGCKGCADPAAPSPELAQKLGVNLIAYVLNYRKLRDKLEEVELVASKPGDVPPRGALQIGQLVHAGEWNPDPGSLANLAKTLKAQTGQDFQFAKKRVVLGQDELGDFPVLYLTGHRNFQFMPSQLEALRTWLDRGGFLLADPCCGKPEFDAAFRRFCEQLYPERKLAPLPATHALLKQPFVLEKLEYKPAVRKLFPQLAGTVQLEALTAPDGRVQVLYSRFNLGCEWQGHGCANCLGVAGADAYKVAVNAILYALSH